MSGKMCKILVAGDVNGKIKQLFQRIESVNKKAGPFEMLICVGDFFGQDHTEWDECLGGNIKAPITTYILGPNSPELSRFYSDLNGCELCTNITYLGKKGILTGASNLKLMYLSGVEGRESDSVHFSLSDVEALQKQSEMDNSLKGIDILITSQWPKGVCNYAQAPDVIPDGSELISYLAKIVRPRYHFCGAENLYYERLPYRNHRVLLENARHVTRFISLANVGNSKKQKWLYAFSMTPLSEIPICDLVKQPPDVTESPYNLEKVETRTTDTGQQAKPTQFFYDMDSPSVTPFGKRKNQNSDFNSKRRLPRKPAQPTGPCWFCLGSPEVEKHLVVSIGNDIYLTLPKGGLVPDHILICSIAHFQATIDLEPEAKDEIEKYKNALRKYFSEREKLPVFFERNFRTQHFQIQVVPVPKSCENKILSAFNNRAEELDLNFKIMPDSTSLCVPPGVPYFYVELPDGTKLIHVIKKHFPLQFGREVLASRDLLNTPEKVDWKNCPCSVAEETAMAKKFKQNFEPYDFTI